MFTLNERVPFFIINRLAKTDRANCFAIRNGDTFVGMAYCVLYEDIVYIFYLAIEEKLRGQGYGSRILAAIKQMYSDKRIILMAEETTDAYRDVEARLKRKQFYYANGLMGKRTGIHDADAAFWGRCYVPDDICENEQISVKSYPLFKIFP